MTTWCNFNGEIIDFDKAGLALNDLGIVRGYGVFDYLRTYNGKPLLLEEHIDRLFRSASHIGLPVTYKKDIIRHFVADLLKKNGFEESHIKIVVTGGPSEDGITVVKPSLYIFITPCTPLPQKLYTDGIKLITHEHLRIFPEAKTINYLTALALGKKKKDAGAYEILYVYKDKVLEGTTSNIFIFHGKSIMTPRSNILEGITRQVVLNLATQDFDMRVRDIAMRELLSADEVFITASNKEVMPVVAIDRTTIGTGKPGKNTLKLRQLYLDFVKKATG